MQPFICEFIGTMILIILGNGVVAGCSLDKSKMQQETRTLQITFGWGFAVLIPAFIFGKASGAHFNPALSLALAMDGSLAWSMLPGYIAAQFAGAFAGACIVWLMYKEQFDATKNADMKFACFSTSPGVRNIPLNIFCEAVATFILVFAIKGIAQVDGIAGGLSNLFVWAVICGIGMSLGGTTGYAINPARDIGPRIAHALLPIQGKCDSHWDYAIVPIAGPVIGALVGVGLYHWIF